MVAKEGKQTLITKEPIGLYKEIQGVELFSIRRWRLIPAQVVSSDRTIMTQKLDNEKVPLVIDGSRKLHPDN